MPKRSNWYALHVLTSKEMDVAAAAASIEGVKAYAPVELMVGNVKPGRWYSPDMLLGNGRYYYYYQTVFTGYVFVGCELTASLCHLLEQIPGVIRLLGVSPTGQLPEPIPEADMWWCDRFARGMIGASRYVREPGGKVCILDGPLKDFEPYISKVELRQHYALVDLPIGGTIHRLRLSLIPASNF